MVIMLEASIKLIDPTRLDLLAAFRANPRGPHAPELQRLVNRLRTGPMRGKYVVVCTRPHREWTLVQLPGRRGETVDLLPECVFTSLADAEWAVFKRRWEEATGAPLDEDRLPDPAAKVSPG